MGRTSTASRGLMAVAIFLTTPVVIASQHFITGHGLLIDTRLDPIRTEGTPATHLHRIAGSSALKEKVTYEELRASDCTTAEVQDDMSLYWQPTLYYQKADGTFQLVAPHSGLTVYWKADKFGDEQLYDMPAGFRMITGDPKRNTPHGDSPEDRANGFECFCQPGGDPLCDDSIPGPTSFDFEEVKQYHCDVIRLGSDFPNCWDGVNLDSPDHKSHVIHSDASNPCPASHPKRIPTTRIEAWYYVNKIPWTTEGRLTLSNGDQTGYSIHADFVNGFSEGDPANPTDSLLVRALMECPQMQGGPKDCPILAPHVQPVKNCIAARKLDEDIGETGPLTKLPGDNPVWSAPSEKPSDPAYAETGKIIDNPGGSVPVAGAPADPAPAPSSAAVSEGQAPPSAPGVPASTDAAPVVPTAAVPTGTVQPIVEAPPADPPAGLSDTAIANPAPVVPTAAVPGNSDIAIGLPQPSELPTTIAAAVGVATSGAASSSLSDVAPAPTSEAAARPKPTWSRGNGWGGGRWGNHGDKTTPVLQNASVQTEGAPAGGCHANKRHLKRRDRANVQL